MTTLRNQQEIAKHEHDESLNAKRVVDVGLPNPDSYDYVGVTYPTTSSEVWVFKDGGSGGTTVSTVTMTYTDSSKNDLSSVEWT